MHTYSSFWLAWAAGLITLSPLWLDREPDEEQRPAMTTNIHPAELLDMNEWLRLSNAHQKRIVASYIGRTPKAG